MKGWYEGNNLILKFEGKETTALIVMVSEALQRFKENPKWAVALKEAEAFERKISTIVVSAEYGTKATEKHPIVARDKYSK